MFNELKSLNIYKSFGPDQVNPKLLHALADNILYVVLCIYFQNVLMNREFPIFGKRQMLLHYIKKILN